MSSKVPMSRIIRTPATMGQRHRYHQLLTMPWHRFVWVFFGLFVGIHSVFATLYALVPGSIQGGEDARAWWNAFCFSVQTLSTIGYGALLPNGLYANVMVMIESFLGLIYVAVLTGCLFAKISRPKSHLVFSEQLLCYPVNGVPNLVFRVASTLDDALIDVSAKVYARIHDEEAGLFRLRPLPLSRDHTPNLQLNWVLFHPLDSASPLVGIPVDRWALHHIRVSVNISGQDRVYQQTVHHSKTYEGDQVLLGHRFADMVHTIDDNIQLDLSKISSVIPLDEYT